ncbi:MAG: hypothetical protein V3575_03850 [Candidatus Absconditabacteria bacterium]
MIKKIINGVIFGSGALIIFGLFFTGIFMVKGTDPLTATDKELLTSEKWNQLVNKVDSIKGLEDAKVITCRYYSTNEGAIGLKTKTWTTADCGGIIPNSYAKCLISNRQTDGNGVHRGLQKCDKNDGSIYLDVTNSEVLLRCEYLCRN